MQEAPGGSDAVYGESRLAGARRSYLRMDRRRVEAILEEMGRRAHWSGLPNVTCESRRVNKVADSIVAYADQRDIDLIVVGASDRSGLLKTLGGSVSREVAAKANCPIVVVRRTRGQPPRCPWRGNPATMGLPELAPSAS